MGKKSKREYLQEIYGRYKKAGLEGKKKILDEFCNVCSYHRKYAIKLLNQYPLYLYNHRLRSFRNELLNLLLHSQVVFHPIGYVIMPNHLHSLVYNDLFQKHHPLRVDNIPIRFQSVKIYPAR